MSFWGSQIRDNQHELKAPEILIVKTETRTTQNFPESSAHGGRQEREDEV